MKQLQKNDKVDIVIYKLSNYLKCELCDQTFETKQKIPFRTIKLCKKCIKEHQDDLHNYIFEVTSDQEFIKIESCDIKGKEFDTDHLTWKQLKDYLNTIENDAILNLPVLYQEHHHFTYIKCNPIIEIRCDNEVKWHKEHDKKFDGDFIRDQYELLLDPKAEDEDYLISNPKQFNLSLTM